MSSPYKCNKSPEETASYKSVDTMMDVTKAVQYLTEFLSSLELPRMPTHSLMLKMGSLIMLVRNLDVPIQCDSTRLYMKSSVTHVIEATILRACIKSEAAFISRIPMIYFDMPLECTRVQFSIRLTFATSIHKAQGYSLNLDGINLETPYVSYGQLYVICL
jgi:hypothetical protein